MADYGLLGALGEGLKSGLGAYQDTQRYALEKKRQAQQDQMAQSAAGFQTGENGQLEKTPEGLLAQQAATAKNTGYLEEHDPNSEKSLRTQSALEPTAKKYGTTFKGMSHADIMEQTEKGLIPKQMMAEAANARARAGFEYRDTGQQNRIDNAAHQATVKRIINDPTSKQRLTQFQNLDNALATIDKAEKLTPQQINEFQQAVRSNLGIKGGGGVGEREETYMKSIGLNAEAFKQFITGDPAEIAKDNKIVEHLRNLAHVEKENIKNQYQQQLDVLTEGNSSMYDRNPELKSDLNKLLKASGKRMGLIQDQGQTQNPQTQAPQTKVINGVTYTKVNGGWAAPQ